MQTGITQSLAEPASVQSLSRPTSAWVTVMATVMKGVQIARRYIPNLIGNFVQLAIRIAFFLLLASSVSPDGSGMFGRKGMSGREIFIFFQGALLLLVFNVPTLWAPIRAVSEDLYNGTLEFLYSNPGSRYAYYVGTVVTQVLISLIVFLPFYGFLVFYSKVDIGGMVMILLVCLTAAITLTAMGIMIALLALLWRQVNSIADVLGMLFEFLGGAYLSVRNFPQIVQYLAYLLPYTWGYDLIRYYSFQGNWQTLRPVWQEWVILLVYAVFYTLLSRYLLKKAEQRAKKIGLHVI